MKTSFIPSRYFIETYDYLYGCTSSARTYMPLPVCELDMEKCLKKWYNHIIKLESKYYNPYIEFHAMVECEDGSFSDLSMSWAYEQMEHDPEIPFC